MINMDRNQHKRVRHVIIQTVLTTDMTKHFVELGQVTARVGDEDFNPVESKDKELFIKFMFHLADISNPTKPYDLCKLWCDLLFIEFFAQGDMEKQFGFDVSQFYDRETTNVAKCQIGFIDFIVKPAFGAVIKVFPKLAHLEQNLEDNKAQWTKRFDEYERELESGNTLSHVHDKYLPMKVPSLTKGKSKSQKKSIASSPMPRGDQMRVSGGKLPAINTGPRGRGSSQKNPKTRNEDGMSSNMELVVSEDNDPFSAQKVSK
jgi:hypothetical protein